VQGRGRAYGVCRRGAFSRMVKDADTCCRGPDGMALCNSHWLER
jgi:hypothetical protein